MAHFQTSSARWAAVVARDSIADGQFVYCVKTTHIYCRPICKARLARRANVEFHDNATAAETAGYRPCKRCKPDLSTYNPHLEVIARARRTIERANPQSRPSLKALASEANLSEWHFHRVFKSITGATPKSYSDQINKVSSDVSISLTPPATLSRNSPISELCPPQQSSPFTSTALSDPSFAEMLSIEIAPEEPFPGFFEQPGNGPGPVLDSTALVSDDHSRSFGPAKDIQYTIQPWVSSLVLIATTQDGICALEIGNSVEELLQTLRSLFPISRIYSSDWDGICNMREPTKVEHKTFATVMSALLHPTGRILNLSFDTVC